MVRKATGAHMGKHTLIAILPQPQVGLVQAIAVHVGGKRRVQERFEILSQELLSDGMTTLLSFTEVEVSQDERGFLLHALIENFHQA